MDYLCGYTATLESKMIPLLQPPPAPATPLGLILLPSHSTPINRENIYFEAIIISYRIFDSTSTISKSYMI